jgi:hypothetical protein
MADSIIIPGLLVVTVMLATMTQLEDLAWQTSDKAVKYSTDMTNAVDCAFTAEALDKCSPDLFSTDFKEETAETQRILEDLRSQQAGANLQH